MKPFLNCCAPSSRKDNVGDTLDAQFIGGSSGYVDGAANKIQMLAGGYHSSSDASDTSGGTYNDVPRGAKVQQGLPTKRTKGEKKGKLELLLSPIENDITWKVERNAKKLNCVDDEELTVGQREYGVLAWCLCTEKSSKMNERLLVLLYNEEQKASTDFSTTTELRKGNYPLLDLVRQVEARLVEEILGDLFKIVTELEGTGGVYVTIKRGDAALGVHARMQGEIAFLSVYQPAGVISKCGAAFFGFSRIDDVAKYVSLIFETVSLENKEKGGDSRFVAIFMKSKLAYLPAAKDAEKDWEKAHSDDQVDSDDLNKLSDPKEAANVVYSAMYDATKKSPAKERVFAWAPQAGMHVGSPQPSKDPYAGNTK